jgi:hypothetical protein
MSINLEARQFVEDFTLTTPEGPKVFDSFSYSLYYIGSISRRSWILYS